MAGICQTQLTDVVLDSIADGVFSVDENWEITSFNRAAERITGVPREEAIGRPCCDVFRASICEAECALRQTLQTDRPVVDKLAYIVSVEGRRVPISISAAPLRDWDDKVIGGVETFRDLSVVEQLRKELQEKYTFGDIIGRSPAMLRLFAVLPQFGDSNSTILIEGASGTGKELFARAIHDCSRRRDRPFVAINCGALPDTLLESELFGYKAGAFTDARRDKPGRFALADGGTIFLDEIGDVSAAMQSKLLRVLQERVYEPLGGLEPVNVDVRVIAATNQDLGRLVHKGIFREDLYYRINIVHVELPPLCERGGDIPLLVEHFISKFNRLQDKHVAGVSPDVMAVLMQHDYPGNVRELENIIEHAFVLCCGGLIEPQHVPPTLYDRLGFESPQSPCGLTLQALETMHIRETIRRHDGNRKAAAERLGIHPSTLFRKIKALGIELPEKDGRCSGR